MSKHFFIIFLAFAVSLLSLPFLTNALTVGPVKLEYTANPGDVLQGSLFIFNEGNETSTFYPVFEKFTEKNGERQFIPGAPTDLSDWFSATSSITLRSKEQKNIPFTIKVPKDASPGGHYAVIWWSTAPQNAVKNQQVAVVTRVGILVYLRVAGEVNESGYISFFDTANQSRLFFSLPVGFSVAFANTGNVHLEPAGSIKIKSIFGQIVASLAVNQYGAIILPQSEKGLGVVPYDSGYAFGPYKASLELSYGESKNIISKSFWIFVFEWQIIIAIAVGLFIVIYVIPKGIKKYNQWIINKDRGRR